LSFCFSDPTKFFGFELGALVTISNDRYIVNGKHSAEDLASRLDQFIEKFVLCKYDRNPETEIQITPKGEIVLHCKACGNVTPVDMTHKLASYILNNPPSKAKIPTKHSQVSTKQQRREAKKTKQREDNESDSENETNEVKGSSKTNRMQFSIVNCQFSIFSCQLSIVDCRFSSEVLLL
jgi:translation initiation factor 5